MPTKNRKVAVPVRTVTQHPSDPNVFCATTWPEESVKPQPQTAILACLAPSSVKLAPFFVAKKRGRGPKAPVFFSLRDSAPTWLRDACYEAHSGDLPSDWIYAQCRDACAAIDNGALTDEDTLSEYADGAVDVYTPDRFIWASEMCLSSTFSSAEDTDRDCGGASGDTCERLGRLQYHAIEAIAATILRAFQEAGES